MKRLGLRGRLTLLYGGLFLIAGAMILTVLYLVVQDRLNQELGREAADDRIAVLRQQAAAAGQETITMPDGSTIPIEDLVAQVHQDRKDIKSAALDSLLVQGSLVVFGIGLAAGAVGWVVAGRGLRPLHAIADTAVRIANSQGPDRDLSERIAMTGRNDDIKRLADSFDAMLHSLDHAFDTQRRFVANASHELRTPLALERALIELEITKPSAPADTIHFGEVLLELNEKSSDLIERLLTLADSGNPIESPIRVDLADLARDAIATVAAAAKEERVEMRADLQPALTTGDPILLEQLIRNLVQNAQRHNVPDGWISLSTIVNGNTAELRISNTGPIVLPHDIDGLFEPFRRSRADRTHADQAGFGLGLAIVKAVTDAHHGTLSAQARPEGGLDLCVRFPSVPEETMPAKPLTTA